MSSKTQFIDDWVKAADKQLDNGKRVLEILQDSSEYIEEANSILNAKASSIGDAMVDLIALRVRVKPKEEDMKLLNGMIAALTKLQRRAEKMNAENQCKHGWIIEGFGTDLAGPWIDIHCLVCESSITGRGDGILTSIVLSNISNSKEEQEAKDKANFRGLMRMFDSRGIVTHKPTKCLAQLLKVKINE